MANLKNAFLSSAFLVTDSIFKKLVGLLSTLVLARVLLPEDFGIIAIATLMTGFLNVFTQTGMMQYIIRSDNPDNKLLNTAFSLNLLLKGSLAVLLAIFAYPIANYYDDPRLILLLQVYASTFMIIGFANPALNLLRRQQQYKKIVAMNIKVKVLSAICAVSIALVFESYWALAIGHFMSITLRTIGSYLIYPYRPRWQLTNVKEQWSFSGWLIPQSLLGYCRTQFDTLMISDMFGKDLLGSYHTMKYLAFIPSSQFISPATEPLLAQMSPFRDNAQHFRIRYTIATIVTMAIAVPVGIFLFYYSREVVFVLLGKNWVEQHELFSWFALLIPAYAMYHNANRTFLIYAKTKFTLIYEIFCAITIISILILMNFDSILELAKIKTSAELLLSSVYFCYAAWRYTNFRYTFIGLTCSLFLVCICVTICHLTSVHINFSSPFFTVFSAGMVFLILYSILCFSFILLTRKCFFVSEYLYSLIVKVSSRVIKKQQC